MNIVFQAGWGGLGLSDPLTLFAAELGGQHALLGLRSPGLPSLFSRGLGWCRVHCGLWGSCGHGGSSGSARFSFRGQDRLSVDRSCAYPCDQSRDTTEHRAFAILFVARVINRQDYHYVKIPIFFFPNSPSIFPTFLLWKPITKHGSVPWSRVSGNQPKIQNKRKNTKKKKKGKSEQCKET
jgi:hypothetical protein